MSMFNFFYKSAIHNLFNVAPEGSLPWHPLGSQGSHPMDGIPWAPKVPSHGIPWAPNGSPSSGSLGFPRVPDLITGMRAVRHFWYRGRFDAEPPNFQAVRTAGPLW